MNEISTPFATPRQGQADTLLAPLDGCPECLARNNRPVYAFRNGDGWVCCYTCWSCGNSWWTAWSDL